MIPYMIKATSFLKYLPILRTKTIMILLFIISSITLTATASENSDNRSTVDNGSKATTVNNIQNNQNEMLSLEQLLAWDQWGKGFIGGFGISVLQMTEDPNSAGLMIVSPEPYDSDVVVSYKVMTLRPATVLVAMLSASNGDGSGKLVVPQDFDGNLGNWTKGATDYFFAFHNAPHSRKPFVNRRTPDGATLLDEADESYMSVGKWHEIEAGRSGNRVWLKIDGETVVDATDNNPIDNGHLAFRIRGSGTERASCFIKDVVIH